MSLATFEHFFGKLFGAKSSIVETVLHDVSEVVNKALPYVGELSLAVGVIEGVAPNAILAKVEAWITKHISDVGVVQQFLTENASAPLDALLHKAAVLVTSKVGGVAGRIASDLDTGVQIAYSVYKAELAKAPASK